MGSIEEAIRQAIVAVIDDAEVEVSGDGRHFDIRITSAAFAGKNTLARHRLVMGALAPLMAGDDAPLHAVASLATRLPGEG